MGRAKTMIAVSLATHSLAVAAGTAQANVDNRNPRAGNNCSDVLNRQLANGQSGHLIGSDNDPKRSAQVANRDHYWQLWGYIGNQ